MYLNTRILSEEERARSMSSDTIRARTRATATLLSNIWRKNYIICFVKNVLWPQELQIKQKFDGEVAMRPRHFLLIFYHQEPMNGI